MSMDMKEQFYKLTDTIGHAVNAFYFNRSRYYGPVNPSAIVAFGSDIIRINALVLAEGVPTFQLPVKFGVNLFETIIVYLNEDFEFNAYDPVERSLGELNVLIGNPEYSYDGTIEHVKSYFEKMNWTFDILFQEKAPLN